MKTNKVELPNLLQQIALLLLMSLFWVPFLFSAQSYKDYTWFNYLFYSRLLLFIIPLGLAVRLALLRIQTRDFIATYYVLAMINQAIHGALEPSNKIDFYSYTSLFLMLSCIAYKGTMRTWIKTYLPIVILAHVLPLFSKDPIFFTSIGHFVDTFTFNVAVLLLSVILLQITTTRATALEENARLHKDLLHEKDMRLSIVESELVSARHAIIQNAELAALANVASQVSHDIRSPLSALNMVASSLIEVPEEKRLIIRTATQRINDIANNLLSKSRDHVSINDNSRKSISLLSVSEPIMLSPVIDAIVSEKRVQLRTCPNVTIDVQYEESYGLFSQISSTEFSRVQSNLLNNAIEAILPSGTITMRIRGNEQNVTISIFDNGKGMPEEVLKRIGEKGLTFGKEGTTSGSGLGLYHAKSTIESSGGTLKVESQLGNGTMVTITLPRAKPPSWFQEELNIAPGTLVVSADDDLSIHQIWTKRLSDTFLEGSKPTLLNFSSVKDLDTWISRNQNKEAIFLVDYEFLGEAENGLDLIEKLKLQDRAVLVTSRFDEPAVLERARMMGVRIIPKGLAACVPICLN